MLSRETRETLRRELDARPINLEEASKFWTSQQGSDAFNNPLVEPIAAAARRELQLDDLPKKQLIVEAGCGRGVLAQQMARASHHVVGVDLTRHPEFPTALFKSGHLGSLPFENESVHALSTHFALPYTNMKEALREIKRVMVPGTRAFVAVHHPDMLEHALEKMTNAFEIPVQLADHIFSTMAPALARNDNPIFRIFANVFGDREEGVQFFLKNGFHVIKNAELIDENRKKLNGLAFWFLLEKPKKG